MFNLEQELEVYPASNMLKAGVRYYIQVNNKTVKSKKDLDKIFKEYSDLKIGE